MKKSFVLLALTAGLLYFQNSYSKDNSAVSINDKSVVKGNIIVKFKKTLGKSSKQNGGHTRAVLAQSFKAKTLKTWKTDAELWNIDTDSLESVIDRLRANPEVQYAEPDYLARFESIPNDSAYDELWAYKNTSLPGADIYAEEAWNISTGDTSVIIGVIDTGIDYYHPDLKPNVWQNYREIPANGIDDDSNGYVDDIYGWDFTDNDNDPMDGSTHGTHVAGIIGAAGNNAKGVAGVAWKCRLVPLRAASLSSILSALQYCINNNIKLTNNSWAIPESDALYEMISQCSDAGIIFVTSAGNGHGDDNDQLPIYPAGYDLPNIISVGSFNNLDQISPHSNIGSRSVDIFAPGSDVLSTTPNNTYSFMTGTSMAAPFVTGAVCLIKSVHPDWDFRQIIKQVINSAEIKSPYVGKCVSDGRLNIYNALNTTIQNGLQADNKILHLGAAYVNTFSAQKNFYIQNKNSYPITVDSIRCGKNFRIKQSSENDIFYTLLGKHVVNSNDSLCITVCGAPTADNLFLNDDIIIYYKLDIPRRTLISLKTSGISSGSVINTDRVNGVWNKAGSPYYINNDISIKDNDMLTILPGVQVLFAGHYRFTVDKNQKLLINGSDPQKVEFNAIDTVTGWNGLNFINSGTDDYIYNCRFSNSKKFRGYNPKWTNDEVITSLGNTGGGAIYMASSAPFIRKCEFINNSSRTGSALRTIWSPADLWIDSCSFINNFAELASTVQIERGSLWITNSSFYYNENSSNGALDLQYSDAYVYKCIFKENQGRAVYTYDSRVFFSNLLVTDNKAGTAALKLKGLKTVLYNSTIANNNCGALIAENGSALQVSGCIFSGNNYNINCENNQDQANVSYSRFDAPVEGTGNITDNPQFADTLNFKLAPSSPCRNSGDPSGFFSNSDGTRNDMGFYGGSGLLAPETSHDFGTSGTISSSASSYDMAIINFRNNDVTIPSVEISQNCFRVAGLPQVLKSHCISYLKLSFASDTQANYSDNIKLFFMGFPIEYVSLPLKGTAVYGENLSGNLTTRITKKSWPYIITNDIRTSSGDTLQIDGGVIFKFLKNVKFEILGRVNIKGERNNPVWFLCTDTAGYFGRINIRGQLNANYLSVKNGQGAGFLIGSDGGLYNCEFIANNYFGPFDNDGIVGNYNNFHDLQIVNTRFEQNIARRMITAFGSPVTVKNCIFDDNNAGFHNNNTVLKIINCTFRKCSGISYLDAYVPYPPPRFDFINNIVLDSPDLIFLSGSYLKYLTINFKNNAVALPDNLIRLNNAEVFNSSGNITNDPLLSDNLIPAANSVCVNNGSLEITSDMLPSLCLNGKQRFNGQLDIGAVEYQGPFLKPSPASPVFGKKLNSSGAVLKWTPSANASGYNLQIAEDSLFTNIISDDNSLSDTLKTFSRPAIRKYFWRVRAKENSVFGDWSNTWKFSFEQALTSKIYSRGWNLISVPFQLDIMKASTIFPEMTSGAYTFHNGYSSAADLVNFKGYWIKLSDDKAVQYEGTTVSQNQIALNIGWNLIGVKEKDLAVSSLNTSPANIINSEFYGYNGAYFPADTLKAGMGYWVMTTQEGSLNTELSNTAKAAGKGSSGGSRIQKQWNKLTLRDAAGRTGTLYLIKEYRNLDRYKLPPLPPAGIFDVRWSSNRYVEKSGINDLMLNGAEYPITLKVEGIDIKITDRAGGQIVNTIVHNGKSLVLTENKFDVLRIESIDIPQSFELSQNYPNPFNPLTKLKYQLPQQSKVTLKIFNALGQEVTTLTDEMKDAGYYESLWNASAVSSGIYICQIAAKSAEGAEFIHRIKMVFIK